MAKIEAENEPGSSRGSEQVRETGEDYLAWFMNRSHIEPMDKMDELDDYMEKERSYLKSLYMSHYLRVIIYESFLQVIIYESLSMSQAKNTQFL